jgi:sugar transferase EpsL
MNDIGFLRGMRKDRSAKFLIHHAFKRTFDIVISICGSLILLPILLEIALAIKTQSRGPVLFKQERPGKNGKKFIIYKFRTMSEEKDINGHLFSDKMRLTSFGKLLRRTSMDEIPELWNVIKGEMSLVGPRPLLIQYLGRYTHEQARRHYVHPGITGWAQIMGRNALTWEEKFRFDLWYIDNWSLWLDLKIIVATFVLVLKGIGINQPGHATMEEFMGSDRNNSEKMES